MLNRIVTVVIIVPIAIVLIALAVANRAPVAITIDPFNPGNAALTWTMPLFVLVFLAVAVGLLVGSFATWLKQGRYRRIAHERELELRHRPAPQPAPAPVVVAPAHPAPHTAPLAALPPTH